MRVKNRKPTFKKESSMIMSVEYAANWRCPLLGIYNDEDPYCNPEDCLFFVPSNFDEEGVMIYGYCLIAQALLMYIRSQAK